MASAARYVGAFAALLAVAAWVRDRYRRTLGRRRDRYERLARLGSGAQLSFFESVLGEPPAIRRTITRQRVDILTAGDEGFDPDIRDDDSDIDDEGFTQDRWSSRDYTECFFIDRDYYVQTILDDDETVLAFSVTTRRRGFRPTLFIPRKMSMRERFRAVRETKHWPRAQAKVKLGRTRFADADSDDPEHWAPPHFRAEMGARWGSYAEYRSFGNPGHYETFVVSAGTNAPGSNKFDELMAIGEQAGFIEWPYPLRWDPDDYIQPPPADEEPSWDEIPAADRLRRHTAITTYTVMHPDLWEVNYPSTFGPHGDEVRTVP